VSARAPGPASRCAARRHASRRAAAQAGQDPKLGPDADYPAWLWALAEPRPPLSELQRRHAAMPGAQQDDLTLAEGLRLVRMARKSAIKGANAATGKE
jgi:large subunit ribosomal protein L54